MLNMYDPNIVVFAQAFASILLAVIWILVDMGFKAHVAKLESEYNNAKH